MKRALFLVYDFPPCGAPGAAVRSDKFVRYLPEFGWHATVVCRDEGRRGDATAGIPVVRIPSPVAPSISYQLAAWLWAARILGPAASLLRGDRFDLIYASCPPFPHALTAFRLSRQTGLPLVVDFRDAWSLDPYEASGWAKRGAKRALCRWVYPLPERRVLEGADEVIANTPSMQREYARAFGWPEEKIHLLPNGFDEADFEGPVAPTRRTRPVFLYCGRFAEVAGRDPGLFLRAVRVLREKEVEIDVRIVGDDSAALRRQIDRFDVEALVTIHGPVPHAEAIRQIREADVLVLYQPNTRRSVSSIAGKTFEYLRSGQPILAIVPPGDNADLVRAYSPVHELVTTFELDHVVQAMESCVRSVRGDEVRATGPLDEFASRYGRRNLTARLAAIFDRSVARRAGGGA